MALIKSTPELQEAFKVDASTRIETIAPYISTAQDKYMPKYLGETLLAALDVWYNTSTPPPSNTWYAKLLPYVQKAIANFAYYLASDDLNISVGENGYTVMTNGNHVPASDARSSKFKENRLRLGYEAIEQMLRFLESNKSQYSSWTSSPAYTVSYRFAINTADDFNDYVDIDSSRLQFTKLWPHMDYAVNNNIVGTISKPLYAKILADLKAGNLSGYYIQLLKPLQMATAYYAWGYNAENNSDNATRALYFTRGQNALNSILAILDANPGNFPEYSSSPQYAATRETYAQYVNKEGNGFHVGGTFS